MVEPAQRLARQLRADATWAAVLDAVASISPIATTGSIDTVGETDTHGPAVYVVGGTVRDLLLGRHSDDLDLAVDGPAIPLARRLANALGAALYPMDVERDVARVLLGPPARGRHVDLAGLRARGIVADLQARDFTINAIALCPGDEAALLDPTGGRADLDRGLLRMASPDAFAQDPLRVLRLARLRTTLDFDVDAETERAARWQAARLAAVADERVRDELLAMLALPGAADGLAYAAHLGALAGLGAAIDDADLPLLLTSLRRIAGWQALVFGGDEPQELAPHGPRLAAYWGQTSASSHPRWLFTRVALLAGACGGRAGALAMIRRLSLSRRQSEHVKGALCGAASLSAQPRADDMAVHRYFRELGAAGVDGAVLALAAAPSGQVVAAARAVLEGWFERHAQVVAPPSLVDGQTLMRRLGLASGPRIGRLLDAVREAQVAGQVRTVDEALAHAARLCMPPDADAVAAGGGETG